MFTKRLFQKVVHRHQRHEKSSPSPDDLNFRINVHYGIPSTASILAFDPIQRLLAIGTLDGRIKVIGGDNIEGLLISPKLLPYKYLEFLQNQGFIVSITNDDDIQVWSLEKRSIACSLQWDSNVTAFSVISGSSFMYVGDEYGLMSVLKYDPDRGQILRLPYQLSSDFLAEATGVSVSNQQPIVGILPQPCSSGNRLLIAYESGLIVLWDVVEAHAVVVRGDKVLQLQNKVGTTDDGDTDIVDDAPSLDSEEKEISALCWTSTDGSILAVGYVDGDILFWNTSKDSSIKDQEAGLSSNVVKLQLSSSEKRLPVIVLHWLDNSKSSKHREGQLLIYGGDEIGSEEVVTVLSLEWSSGMEAVRCTGRTDLTLTGSFADMILVPSAGTTGCNTDASLFVLSNPGRIHIYSSDLQPKEDVPVSALNFPVTIPTVDPLMTVAELFHVSGSTDGLGSKITVASSTLTLPGNKRWPLTGGIINHLSSGKDDKVQRLYVTGYQDGSVRIWDATYPVFSLLCVLTNEAKSENLVDSGASLTTVDLCSSTLRLAVGNECGRVELYKLCSSNETSIHFVTETKSEVRSSAQVQGPRCGAVFNLHKSGVQALRFINQGSKLIVAHECSRIAVIDVQSSSVAFITDSIPTTPVISVLYKAFDYEMVKKTNESAPKIPDISRGESIFVLTKEGSIYVIDGNNGSMISSRPVQLKKSTAISVYLIENQLAACSSVDELQLQTDDILKNEPLPSGAQGRTHYVYILQSQWFRDEANLITKSNFPSLAVGLLFSGKTMSVGWQYSIRQEKWRSGLPPPFKFLSCLACIKFPSSQILNSMKQSLPDLELVKEFSLLSELRWNFKPNMERMISSVENLHIALANGSEVAFVSLLEGQNDFRIPESLPSLHDEVLAAAANAAISISSDQKRKQGGNPGILSGIVKGLRGPKPNKLTYHDSNSKADFSHLEGIFVRNIIPEPLLTTDEPEAVELTIDDIDIDEPGPLASTSSHELDSKNKDKKVNEKNCLTMMLRLNPDLERGKRSLLNTEKRGMPHLQLGKQKTSFWNAKKNLRKLVDELKTYKTELKTSRHWPMSLSRQWKIESGITYNRIAPPWNFS
ncbi:hypothetical protein C2S51_009182 [Perilla frutescens var. frutescens]|nr:hypothetical protein C2S51_009182 [Perilla frutescens var. frutescens]